jgi:hypothetical protein
MEIAGWAWGLGADLGREAGGDARCRVYLNKWSDLGAFLRTT